MRSVHEANRLLIATVDPNEDRIVRRWLADKKVTQADARKAEQRGADRIANEMRAVGMDPGNPKMIGDIARIIYGDLSEATHLRRRYVDDAVDTQARTMIYGPDPSIGRRAEYATYAGRILQESERLLLPAARAIVGAHDDSPSDPRLRLRIGSHHRRHQLTSNSCAVGDERHGRTDPTRHDRAPGQTPSNGTR